MRTWLLLFFCMVLNCVHAQKSRHTLHTGISAGAWSQAQTLSLSAIHTIGFFYSQQLKIGYGLRLNTLREDKTRYECDCNKTVILDPVVKFNTSANLMVQLSYGILEPFSIGFNIDLAGLRLNESEGFAMDLAPMNNEVPSYYVLGQSSKTSFNALLGNTNDIGQLNSEFFVSAELTRRLSARIGLSHYFISYKGNYGASSVKTYHFYNLPFVHLSYMFGRHPKSIHQPGMGL